MIVRDYHGWRIQAAENDVHLTVGRVRRREPRLAETVEFIVGHGGPIRRAVIKALDEYDIEPRNTIGNPGSLTVIIE